MSAERVGVKDGAEYWTHGVVVGAEGGPEVGPGCRLCTVRLRSRGRHSDHYSVSGGRRLWRSVSIKVSVLAFVSGGLLVHGEE